MMLCRCRRPVHLFHGGWRRPHFFLCSSLRQHKHVEGHIMLMPSFIDDCMCRALLCTYLCVQHNTMRSWTAWPHDDRRMNTRPITSSSPSLPCRPWIPGIGSACRAHHSSQLLRCKSGLGTPAKFSCIQPCPPYPP